jgi:hypothetical protein
MPGPRGRARGPLWDADGSRSQDTVEIADLALWLIGRLGSNLLESCQCNTVPVDSFIKSPALDPLTFRWRMCSNMGSILIRALLILVLTSGPAVAFELGLPIVCTLGEDCFLQQYVDRDPGPGIADYTCGTQTYDGHKGTDIRIRTTADVQKSVAVVAAAPGVVVGLRDGMPDHLVHTEEDRAALADQQCGNGVRIDHGAGWQTQYCHLRQGSVSVMKGQHVAAGTKLGEVGYSGHATFPHVHLQVTKDGNVIDPFLPDLTKPCGSRVKPLWSGSAFSALAYRPGTLLAVGLTDRAISLEELEASAPLAAPSRGTPVVAYMWAINLQKGDVVDIEVTYEGKGVVKNSERLERNKAQFMLFAGKKPPADGWLEGTYTAAVEVTREGKPVLNGSQTMALK